MTDFDTAFRALDALPAPSLARDIERRSKTAPSSAPPASGLDREREPTRRRLPAALVAFAVFLAGAAIVWSAFGNMAHPTQRPRHAALDPWTGYGAGWTRLPDPPQVRSGAAAVWTGSHYLYWGGYPLHSKSPSKRGYSFDPATHVWTDLPAAPEAASNAQGIWTGSLAIFFGGYDAADRLNGAAYDPSTESWRRLPPAPVDATYQLKVVWTGVEMIAWGASTGKDPVSAGAAFDPASWAWHPIAGAPIILNAFTAVWSGSEMVVFGSDLNGRNHATAPVAQGEAYSPATDTWKLLPRSALSPQASTIAWIDGRLVAYDYGLAAAELDPSADHWTGLPQVPLSAGECYPDSAVIGTTMVAFYCGHAVAWNAGSDWSPITGGLVDETVAAYGSQIQLYRFADLTPAGSVLLFAAEGVTVNKSGAPCYGCSGAPHQFWAFRPPPPPAPTPSAASPSLRPGATHIKMSPGESRSFPKGELHTGDLITCPGRGAVTVSVPGQMATSSIGLTANRGLNGSVYANCDRSGG